MLMTVSCVIPGVVGMYYCSLNFTGLFSAFEWSQNGKSDFTLSSVCEKLTQKLLYIHWSPHSMVEIVSKHRMCAFKAVGVFSASKKFYIR